METPQEFYRVSATIEGIAPILQHSFTQNHLAEIAERSKKRTGAKDYSLEWLSHMYVTTCDDGKDYICQPANHIEGAMVRAAVGEQIAGRGKKTYKDLIRANLYVSPEAILHIRNGEFVPAPDENLAENPANGLSISVMRVVVQRAAVARARLEIAAGWRLTFDMTVIDADIGTKVLEKILREAGGKVGIGDYRPRYGRFRVIDFQVIS